MRYFSLFILTFLVTACSTPKPELQTVGHVEVNKYLGTWYEIARYEHFFEVGCSDVSATYSLKENGDINVLNSCTKDGKKSDAKGSAYATDETNSKLKVSFFWPFYGDYWVLMLDENYTYAVIGEPSREYFWILSRTKTIDEELKRTILTKMPEFLYDAKQLIWTKQSIH